MPLLLTCERCHQWEQEIDAPPDVPFICPVCGGPVPDIAPSPLSNGERGEGAGRSEDATLARPLADDPALETGTAPGAGATRLADRDWPTIAGYEVLGELGRGGMGVVYKARQIGLNRIVALKMILSGQHAGDSDRARFKAEAEAVARLVHPNIVQIHEVGESNGCPFFSLEYVDGGSLAGKLDGTPWRPRPAAGLVETLARAVQTAHKAGVVHRDLKPANVLLTAEGQPKITDFGLAKKLDDAAGQTQSGAIVGTPSYMAPEQAGNKAVKIGPAADVYALGAILYELLTGRPPFKAATTLDTVLQVISDEPVSPRHLQPTLPRDVETICLKCLRKEPAKRYTSAEDLAEDLARYLDGKPITARRVGWLERGWRWRRRNPVVAGMATAVFLSLAAGVGVASWFALQAHDEAQQVREEQRKTLDEALNVRRHLYDAQMSRIQLAWEENERDSIPQLLDEQRPGQTSGTDLRGFEWYFWSRRKATPVFALSPLGGLLHTDGRRVASLETVAGARRVVVRDATTGNEIWTFPTPIWPGMECVAFSPDGRFLAVGGQVLANQLLPAQQWGFTLRIYDGGTGTELRALEYAAAITSIEFSPDSKRLASASADGIARVWDAELGTPLFAFQWPDKDGLISGANIAGASAAPLGQGPLLAASALVAKPTGIYSPRTGGFVAFQPGTNRLLWTRDAGAIGWDLATGEVAFSYTGHYFSSSWALSPDGKRLARPFFPTGLVLLDAETGREAGPPFTGVGGQTVCVAWSFDGTRLATGHFDGAVKVWDAATGKEIETIRGHKGQVAQVAFSADGKQVLSSGWDGIKAWRLSGDANAYAVFTGRPPYAFSPDGARLAALGPGHVTLWDVAGRREERTIRWREPPQGLAFSPDGTHLLGWSARGAIQVWNVADGTEAFTLQDASQLPVLGAYRAVEYSPDGRTVVYAGGGLSDRIGGWDVETRKTKPSIDVTEHGATTDFKMIAAVFSPDRRRIALAFGTSHTLEVCDATNGSRLFTTDVESSFAAFSSDGRLIVGGDRPNPPPAPVGLLAGLIPAAPANPTVVVWDAETGKRIATLKEYLSPADSAVFSPDSRRLAAVSADGVRVWDLETKNEVLSLKGMTSVLFSPDGRFLACGDAVGVIRVWNIEPKD